MNLQYLPLNQFRPETDFLLLLSFSCIGNNYRILLKVMHHYKIRSTNDTFDFILNRATKWHNMNNHGCKPMVKTN